MPHCQPHAFRAIGALNLGLTPAACGFFVALFGLVRLLRSATL